LDGKGRNAKGKDGPMVEAEHVIKKVPQDIENALTEITRAVKDFQSEITVGMNNARYKFAELFVGGTAIEKNGKSVMALRTFRFKEGFRMQVSVKGRDEKETLQVYMEALEKYL